MCELVVLDGIVDGDQRGDRGASVGVEGSGRAVGHRSGGPQRAAVNDVALKLCCDWHTVNDAVIAYGTALVEEPERIGEPTALGWTRRCSCRKDPAVGRGGQRRSWMSNAGVLFNVVPGRDSTRPCRWLAGRSESWPANIAWATLDLSGPYRSVFDTMLPDAVQVADPLHIVAGQLETG